MTRQIALFGAVNAPPLKNDDGGATLTRIEEKNPQVGIYDAVSILDRNPGPEKNNP